ncbi:MAG: hypothetical protein JO121_02065 [Deltaproteobacteria bacterium]|nr:hypothetical protein [Deltaproteobacteria bacterium]
MTSDGGLVLVHELDKRLGFDELVDRHLSDSRRRRNIVGGDLAGTRAQPLRAMTIIRRVPME